MTISPPTAIPHIHAVAATPPPDATVPDLHSELMQVALLEATDDDVKRRFRAVLQSVTQAVVVGHLQAVGGEFDADALVSDRSVPSALDAELLVQAATTASQRQSAVVRNCAALGTLICTPIDSVGSAQEVLVLLCPPGEGALRSSLFAVELTANYQRMWMRGHGGAASQWKLNALAAIVELVSDVERQDSWLSAAHHVVHQVAKFLGCQQVALARWTGRDLKVVAISGVERFDGNSGTVRAIREALYECKLHGDVCQWPPGKKGPQAALLGHKKYSEKSNASWLLSAPLTVADGELLGVWLLWGRDESVPQDRLSGFLRAASPRIAGALDVLAKSQRGVLPRVTDAAKKMVCGRKLWVTLVVAGLCMSIMSLPSTYHVRCRCLVQPVTKRLAVAPFSGMIRRTLIDSGDLVKTGDLLAEMDPRELAWELSAAQAQRGQAAKQRQVDLTARNVSQVLVTQLELERLDARIALLRHRRDHLQLKAPIDGVILSGELERGQTAPVKQGDVLYEISPLDELKIEIEVPAEEVAIVDVGQAVKVWVDGYDGQPWTGVIESVKPISELRRNENVFLARLTIPNRHRLLRPGMRGSVRIDGPERPVAWNLFHKPWEYLVARLTWW